ncbi:alpha-keto acid decarboxylase family protein [Candidatus Poribacteria bacterium]
MEGQRDATIGDYLLAKLQEYGIQHVFGIPGDYVLRFYQLLEQSPIRHVGMTREDAAGYAADAYARVHGIGAACVTYCVGGLSMTNSIAGAYAEKSPVIVISGAPGIQEQRRDPLLHHKVRNFLTQKQIYDQITVAGTILNDPVTAFDEIDRVFDIVYRQKRPGYIELPRDMVDARGQQLHQPADRDVPSDPDTLRSAVQEIADLINEGEDPVILAGVELHRFGFQDKLLELIEKTNIPVAATVLGKSVIREDHPLYLGIYEGAMGRDEVRQFVEDSDCVIILGAFMTDMNLGIYTAKLDREHTIYVTSEKVLVKYHTYEDVTFSDLLDSLLETALIERKPPALDWIERSDGQVDIQTDAPITVIRLFKILNGFIVDDMMVIADIGDSLFGAIDLKIHQRTDFLSPAYYTSMGFAVPASIGGQLARPEQRTIVIVGDGAFQMTGLELSTSVRIGLNPIVIVLNNHGYGTERQLQEGAFNDIGEWNYSQLPTVLGAGKGFVINTEGELDNALKQAVAHTESFVILDVQLDKLDQSPALMRLAERLSKQV